MAERKGEPMGEWLGDGRVVGNNVTTRLLQVASIASSFFVPRREVLDEVDRFQKKVGWSKNMQTIGLHIRGSDSCKEAVQTKRVCDTFDDVIPDLRRVREKYGIANVFVATDNVTSLHSFF